MADQNFETTPTLSHYCSGSKSSLHCLRQDVDLHGIAKVHDVVVLCTAAAAIGRVEVQHDTDLDEHGFGPHLKDAELRRNYVRSQRRD